MAVPIAGILAATDFALALLQTSMEIQKLIQTAQKEGRDISREELSGLAAKRRDSVKKFMDGYGPDSSSPR